MTSFPLTPEEQEILSAFEAGILQEDREKKANTVTIAKNTLLKRKSINIRIPEQDLYRLKVKAIQKGMPYQTLVVALLHEYSKTREEKEFSFA